MDMTALREYIEDFNTIMCEDDNVFIETARLCEKAGIPLGFDPERYAKETCSSDGTRGMSLGGSDKSHLHFFCRRDQAYYPNNRFIRGEELEWVFLDEPEYDASCLPDPTELFGGVQ